HVDNRPKERQPVVDLRGGNTQMPHHPKRSKLPRPGRGVKRAKDQAGHADQLEYRRPVIERLLDIINRDQTCFHRPRCMEWHHASRLPPRQLWARCLAVRFLDGQSGGMLLLCGRERSPLANNHRGSARRRFLQWRDPYLHLRTIKKAASGNIIITIKYMTFMTTSSHG